ncbi:hypothetical protein OOK60_09530 [Trichothermofontia sichuanensis B231]|uniref:DUF6920 family protein n=1 Tax=Trichothermofontia sichuanensis TaxID=3045816 RepID=UPI0022469580|nr:DUF6544 family protein [Trichothermofontia sichuanensis]UZQ52779.1 hypothetical protein OOK60_09530 [Trichothermofontia sichuanensis B231]
MFLKVSVVILCILLATLIGLNLCGFSYWQLATQTLRNRLQATHVAVQPQRVNFEELDGLPAPVQRYFRKSLQNGQPMVVSVKMRHRGTFNLSQTVEKWHPFTSEQRVVTQRPGFAWNADIRLLLGVPIMVHDAYIAGEGILHAALFGLFSLVNIRGTGKIAEGQLMRFLAESAWYPTALLPSQGIHWQAVSDRSAQGTMTDGTICLTMLFTFNDQDLIERVEVESRGRTVDGKIIPTPWYGYFWNYTERSGMQVPLNGEVAWLLPDGAKPYWRGRIIEIIYEFTP